MFNDLDESLRELLITDVPIERTEVDIEFDRPSREWSSRLSRPTLNLFLYDIRERVDMRDDVDLRERRGDTYIRRRPARRLDCSYIVTAWAKEAADEHRILAHVLSSMYRHAVLPADLLQGDLKTDEGPDVLLRVVTPDHHAKPADFWGVMDNELRVSLNWVATVPLDAFRPFTTPVVRTAEFAVGAVGETWRERTTIVGGRVQASGEPREGVTVTIAGTGMHALTDRVGQFQFGRVAPGTYTIKVEEPGAEPREVSLAVPSENYDIELS